MPKVSLALDGLTLDGAGEQTVLDYSGMQRSQVCWSHMNSHSHKQMNKEAKNQAWPGCNRDSRDASVCWLCGAPTHC